MSHMIKGPNVMKGYYKDPCAPKITRSIIVNKTNRYCPSLLDKANRLKLRFKNARGAKVVATGYARLRLQV